MGAVFNLFLGLSALIYSCSHLINTLLKITKYADDKEQMEAMNAEDKKLMELTKHLYS